MSDQETCPHCGQPLKIQQELEKWQRAALRMAEYDSYIAEQCGLIEDENGEFHFEHKDKP